MLCEGSQRTPRWSKPDSNRWSPSGLVPPTRSKSRGSMPHVFERPHSRGGTTSSNPLCSSAESIANLGFRGEDLVQPCDNKSIAKLPGRSLFEHRSVEGGQKLRNPDSADPRLVRSLLLCRLAQSRYAGGVGWSFPRDEEPYLDTLTPGRSVLRPRRSGRGASSLPASTRHGVFTCQTNARSAQHTKPGSYRTR
jgi:hypothetical protein